MRITYVTETYPPELNGVALTVDRTVTHLREQGHEVDLIRPRQPGEAPRQDSLEWRTAGWPIPMYRDLRFGVARQATLRRRLGEIRPDVVHVATPGPLGWTAVEAARELGLAVTSDFRTNFHQYSRYYGLGILESTVCRYLRALHNRTHCTFVPTTQLHRELAQTGFEHMQVVGRGVDTQRFSPQWRSPVLRMQWGVTPGTPVLLYVGRLAAEKNVDLALQAWRRVQQRQPEAQMVVVGDGPLRGALQRRYPDAHFVGIQRGEALSQHYASADFFLFPSRSETFGNVTLEALASGLATIAFDTAAAAEHIVDGVSGRLVPMQEEQAFIAAVANLTEHHDLLGGMRAQAREEARRADWDCVLSSFTAHLQLTAHAHRTSHATDPCLA